jgi:uncharacterized protein (TIGR02145 family)
MSSTKCFKIILSILFLLVVLKLEAQTTVSIGSGTTRSANLPIISNYGYSYSQQLYLASEYTTAGGTGLTSISKLRLYYNGTGTGAAAGTSPATSTFDDWTIYMGNTSKTSFASSTDWVPSSALTQVFSGTVTFPAAGNWMEITFATPFLWDGTSNLVVAVDENKLSYGTLVYWGAITSGVTNRGIVYRSDSTNPNPASPPTASSRQSGIPFVQFVAQAAAGCQTPAAQPTALAFSSVTGTSLSGSFTVPSPAPMGYMVVRSTSATAPTAPTDGTALAVGSTTLGAGTYVVANTSTGSFTDSGLTANTQYYYYIYAYNSGCVGTPPKYLATAPLTGNVITCMPTPTSAAATALTTSSFTANWTGAVSDAGYELEVSTSSTFATLLAGYPVTVVNNGTGIGSYVVSDLSHSTVYYYRVRATGTTCNSANSTSQTAITSCGVNTAPTVAQTFASYVPVCWYEATGAIGGTVTAADGGWMSEAGMANTGTNPAVRINLYSTKNDWLISQSIDLGSGRNFAAKFNMAVTSYLGTTSQSTLGSHQVKIVVSTDNGLTWSAANVIKTYTGSGTYSVTGVTETISLAGYSGVVRIGFLAQTTSTSPDIDFHIDNFEVVAVPPVVTSFLPAAACVDSGASVTITGANLANATGVTVNGTAATITANTSTSLTFTMPNGASTGVVAVTTAEGSGASTANFTVNAYPVLEDIVGGGVSLCKSETVQLSNTTTGGVWTSTNTAIATVNSAGLVTAVSEGTATITYTVTVSGCATAKTTSITVNNPPVITAQANNQIVLNGADASYAITATGTGITYQWQVSTDNGATWNNIEGATNSYYILAAASSADNGKQFQCVVSGTAPCAAATSNVVTLSVGSVSITAQPTNQTVCSNAGATFAVSTVGEVTSYQWQVSTDNGATWINIEGGNAASLVLSGITSANTGNKYFCLINGGVTNGGVNSDPATLTVFDAVAIGTQPASQTVCSNVASVAFTTTATGSGLAYQWQMSTNGTDWSNVTGATAATYTINTPSVSLNNNQYRVVVSGTAPCSAVTSDTVTVTVNNPVVVTASPANQSVCINGGTATFEATATGDNLSYQWQMSTNGSTWSPISGAITATLTVTNPTLSMDGYQYQVVVSGAANCASVTSSAATLNVLQNVTYYVDADGDGIGAGTEVYGCLDEYGNLPPGYSWDNYDCNDNDANSISYANYFYVDADGDGVGAGEAVSFCSENPPPGYSWDNGDCNDNDANFYETSYWYGDVYIDTDGDGFGSGNPISSICLNSDGSLPQGYSWNNSDCDDHFFSSNGLCPLTLNVKLYLQGYYKSNQNQMTPLRKNARVSQSEDEVDEVTVSLYSKYDVINPIIATATAVVGTNGTVGLQFAVLPNEYYILVEHKNTIKTWSATPVAITNGTTYDFTTAASQAYGNNQIEVAPGVYAIYSGDMNQDGTINEADLPIFTTANTTAAHGYVVSDLNGDGSVDLLDYPIYKNNAAATVNAVRPVPLPIASLPNVTIGTQVWQSTNLDVTTYRDGTPIPQVTDPNEWFNLTTGAWCYYNNDPTNGTTYGKLYNWYAVAGIHDNDPNTPNKILAPEGWHIPTDAEWTTLTTFLGGDSVAGGKMKEIGTSHWRSPNTGATNSSGFTGLPAGLRTASGTFGIIRYDGDWWSSSEHYSADAWNRRLYSNDGSAGRNASEKRYGFSVRCLRD